MARNSECIYDRGTSWQVKIPYFDKTGKRTFYTESFNFKRYGSKELALKYAKKDRDEARIRIANDMVIKEKRASLEEIYKKAFDLHQVSLSTRRKDDSNFYNHIANVMDISRDFKTIRFSDIQEQLNSMITTCSQDMIKRALYIWRTCYKFAIADDYVIKDETLKVVVPKSELVIKKKDQTTSYSEVIKAIDLVEKKTQDPRNRMLYINAIWLILYMGMRPSECFALEVNAVDVENRKIKIYQRIGSSTTERYTIVKVKTDSSIRSIDYPMELDFVIKELVDNAIDGYLFMRKDGKLLNGDIFSDRLNKATGGTFRAYPMRHQLTTDLITQGTDLRTIMELMGHSEATMTLYYARSNEQRKKDAINNRIINGIEKEKEQKSETKTA